MSYPNSHHNVNGRLRTTQLASSAYALSHRAALWMLIRSCLRVRGSYVLQCHQEHWISRHWTTAARGCMGFEFCQPLVTAFWSNDQIFLPSAPLLLRSPPWLWSFPPPTPPRLCQLRGFLVCGNFSSFTAPSQRSRSHPYSFSLFFLFSFALPRYVGSFLPFGKSEVFCQRSVGVLQELFHM